MKRLSLALLVAVVLLPLAIVNTAHAGTTAAAVLTVSASETVALAAPTLVTQGLDLTGVSGVRTTVCAAAGQTLLGGGSLDAYIWVSSLSVWARAPALDVSLTGSNGSRCMSFDDQGVRVPRGRVFFAADNVTVSSGTTVTVILEGTQR